MPAVQGPSQVARKATRLKFEVAARTTARLQGARSSRLAASLRNPRGGLLRPKLDPHQGAKVGRYSVEESSTAPPPYAEIPARKIVCWPQKKLPLRLGLGLA